MRISILLAAVVATTVFGTAIYLNAQGQPGARSAAPQSGGTKVAVIDVGFIFKNADRFKAAMEDLKTDDARFQKEVQARTDAIKAQVEKLKIEQKGSQNYKALEERIAGDQTKLRLDVARKQKDGVENQAKIYFNAYRDIEFHINKFATRYGIDLVLRFNSEEMDPTKPDSVLNGINRFVVYQRNLNITGNILEEMNRRGTGPRPTTGPTPGPSATRPFVPPNRKKR